MMMRWSFALLALVPATAEAQTLWRDVEAGMTVSQIRNLYPPGTSDRHQPEETLLRLIDRVGACLSDVAILHPQGRVTAVRVGEVRPRTGNLAQLRSRCGQQALPLLVERYGNPDLVTSSVAAGGVSVEERTWVRDGVAVGLRLYSDQQGRWTITYRPAAANQAPRQPAQPRLAGLEGPGAGAGLLIARHAPTGTEVRLRETGSSVEFVSTSRDGLSVSYDIDIDANGRIDPNVDLSYGWHDNDLACASERLTENSWTGCSVTRSRGRGSREVTAQGRISRWTIPVSEIAPGGRAFGYRVKFWDPQNRRAYSGPSGIHRLGAAQQNASAQPSRPQPLASPSTASAQQIWQDLKRDLEAVRVQWSSGRVTTYRLTGQPCRSQFTQIRRGGGYEADEEGAQVDWARLAGVDTELGSVANFVRLEGSDGFSIQVDSRERALRVRGFVVMLVQACRAG